MEPVVAMGLWQQYVEWRMEIRDAGSNMARSIGAFGFMSFSLWRETESSRTARAGIRADS